MKSLRAMAAVRSLVMFAFLSSVVLLTACEWGSIGYNKGYAPEQPIAFPHDVHAGQYKIACLYCHAGVQLSNHSPVPSMNICMNCHMVVPGESDRAKEQIQKLTTAYTNNEPIPWVKVHMLPDFVKFNHKRHVERFGVPDEQAACKTCHGPVETMDVLYQYSSLSMGWCVDCHRENQAPLNCSTCHY